jgi:hypothetical protein
MAPTGTIPHQGGALMGEAGNMNLLQRSLLACGLLAALLYVATDLLGGLRYPGYSFTAQAISELAARGAPSEPFVARLFLGYDVLALAFGIGVLRGAGRDSSLRIAAFLLTAHAIIGLGAATRPDVFEMQQRGAGSFATDAPHLVLMGVIVALLLLAMAFGAFALGRRFRVFSFATIAVMLLFGAVTTQFSARVASGQPTPGLGVVERVDVYSSMLWLAVLSVALLRRSSSSRVVRLP